MKNSLVSVWLGAIVFVAIVMVSTGALAQPPVELPPQASVPSEPIRDRYVVVFKDTVANPAAEARGLMRGQGGQIHHVYTHALRGFAATIPPAAYNAIKMNPNVEWIEQDITVYPGGTITQTDATWGLDRIDQRELLLSTTYQYDHSGLGVTAYVIDSGIRYSHTDFGGRARLGKNFVDDTDTSGDCNGHGTHVAGTIGGATWGVAKGVELVSMRVFPCSGGTASSTVIAAVDWITANGTTPAVVNMSLGGGKYEPFNTAVANSVDAGFVYVVSAGNSDQDACLSSPASTPSALTVGSTASNDARSSFSNWGSCVDVFAPGSSIRSAYAGTDTATATLSGTSMAAPHVAGVVALLLQQQPGATPVQVGEALLAGATKGVVTDSKSANNDLLYSRIVMGEPVDSPPSVTTGSVSNIGETSATVSGTVTSAGTHPVTGRGVCIAVAPNAPSTCTPAGQGTGSFSAGFSDLVPNTGYNVAAYATSSVDTVLGEVLNFTTLRADEAPPAVESVSSESSKRGPQTNVSVTWVVRDDLALASVTVTLLSGGTEVASSVIAVEGDRASGTTSLSSRATPDFVTVRVLDAAGKEAVQTCSVGAACSGSGGEPPPEEPPPDEPPPPPEEPPTLSLSGTASVGKRDWSATATLQGPGDASTSGQWDFGDTGGGCTIRASATSCSFSLSKIPLSVLSVTYTDSGNALSVTIQR
jgi:aqualysin 1